MIFSASRLTYAPTIEPWLSLGPEGNHGSVVNTWQLKVHTYTGGVFSQVNKPSHMYDCVIIPSWVAYIHSTITPLSTNMFVKVLRVEKMLLKMYQLIEAERRIYASENQVVIGSDMGLQSGRHQAIIWTSAGILLLGSLGTNFGEILIEIHILSLKKMYLKMSSEKWRPFCLGLNVFIKEFM